MAFGQLVDHQFVDRWRPRLLHLGLHGGRVFFGFRATTMDRHSCRSHLRVGAALLGTARSWRGIVPFTHLAREGAYDSHHRTAGIAGRTRRRGAGVAAHGARAAAGDAGGRVFEPRRIAGVRLLPADRPPARFEPNRLRLLDMVRSIAWQTPNMTNCLYIAAKCRWGLTCGISP